MLQSKSENSARSLLWHEGVNRIYDSLFATEELDSRLALIGQGVVDVFGADFCRIWMIRPGDRCNSGCPHAAASDERHRCRHQELCLHLVTSSGRYTRCDGMHSRVPYDCYKIGRIASGKDATFLTNDVIHDTRVHDHEWARQLGLVSFAGYQLRNNQGKVNGVLAFFATHEISAEQHAILENVANTTAQVIQVGLHTEELEERVRRRTEELVLANDGLQHEIAEHKKTEKQLRRAQKMEAIGLMAGGVAHDLNNILSGIVSYPELLLHQLPEDSPLERPLQVVRDSGKRAAAVVADLLSVAKGVASERQVADLNNLMNDYLSSAEHQQCSMLHPAIVFDTRLDDNLLHIECSPVHIKKIIMNLTSNAAEAITGKGRVTFSTSNRYLDMPVHGYDTIEQGEYVVLSVADNGPGIARKDLDRIFEPFYTKKVMGRSGTGLGLAVVWNGVQDHDGYINVMSSQDGTTFEVYFPATRKIADNAGMPVGLNAFQGNGETVLVVDDEPAQREIACHMLRQLGYKATSVAGGEEAVDYIRGQDVDLVMLDMIMDPGLNGRETFEKIKEIKPDQKSIIASGFAASEEVKRAQLAGAGTLLKKPYTMEQLAMTVYEKLGKEA